MKRFLSLLSVFFVVISCFSGCGKKEPSSSGLLLALIEESGEGNAKSVLYSGTEASGFETVTEKDFGRLYTGKWEEPACFSRISDFAVRLSEDESGFEIHVVRCVNRSDTAEVETLLAKRIKMIRDAEIRQYAPESFEKYFDGAEIYVRKNYVFLLASPDNEKLISEIKRLT